MKVFRRATYAGSLSGKTSFTMADHGGPSRPGWATLPGENITMPFSISDSKVFLAWIYDVVECKFAEFEWHVFLCTNWTVFLLLSANLSSSSAPLCHPSSLPKIRFLSTFSFLLLLVHKSTPIGHVYCLVSVSLSAFRRTDRPQCMTVVAALGHARFCFSFWFNFSGSARPCKILFSFYFTFILRFDFKINLKFIWVSICY